MLFKMSYGRIYTLRINLGQESNRQPFDHDRDKNCASNRNVMQKTETSKRKLDSNKARLHNFVTVTVSILLVLVRGAKSDLG